MTNNISSDGIFRVINTTSTDYAWLNKTQSDAKGGRVELIIDGVTNSIKIGDDGKWSYTPPDGWEQGMHTVQLIVIDRAGNRSIPVMTILNIDATAPEKPEIWRAVDNSGSDKGYLTPGEMTDERKPVLSGVAEPGTVVYLYDNNDTTAIGSAAVNTLGAWTITPDLADGAHSLTVVAKDVTGNTSVKSDAFSITITNGVMVQAENEITVAPEFVPVSTNDFGTSAAIKPATPIHTNKNILSFNLNIGANEAGSLVQLIIDDKIYTTRVDAAGNWSFTSPELADGMHIFQYRVRDRAGNWSVGIQRIYDIDTAAPEKPEIMRMVDNMGDMEYLSLNQYTNDKTPTMSGVAQPDSMVFIYGTAADPIGSVQAGADGRWSYEAQLTTDGVYVFSAAYKDSFGVMSVKSDNFTLNLDTTVPEVPELNSVWDDFGSRTGQLFDGDITDDSTPTLKGVADVGTIIRVWDGETLIASTTVGSRGSWELDLDLADGEHSLRIDSVSKGGTASPKTDEFKLIVDPNLVPVPVIGEVVDNSDGNANERVLKEGDATKDTTPVLRGSGNEGDIVIVIDNDKEIGSVVVGKDGKWQIEIPAQAEGAHKLEVVVEDKNGNRSEPSDPVNIVIDITPPTKPSEPGVIDNNGDNAGEKVDPGTAIDDPKPTIGGDKGKEGDKVEVIIIDKDGNKEVIGTAIVDKDGKWTVTPVDEIEDGKYDLIVEITDPAGNTSEPSDKIELIIDTKVPDALPAYGVWDDVGPIQGEIKEGMATDDTTPTVKGTGVDGSEVIVYDNGAEIGRTKVVGGEWSFVLPAIPEGAHKITVQPISESGVKGPESAAINFTVDTTPPPATDAALVQVWYNGKDADHNWRRVEDDEVAVSDNTFRLTGTGKAGAVVVVYADKAHEIVLGSTTVPADGRWTVENTTPLDESLDDDTNIITSYHFNIGVRDAAGNETQVDKYVEIIVDTKPPEPGDFDDQNGVSGTNDIASLMSMSLNEILSQGEESLFIDNGKTQLLVTEEAGKELQLEDILPEGENVDNWSQANGTVTVAGVEYNVYQNTGGEAEVLVPQHLMQEQQ